MPGRYTREELLRLRTSPLISRPESLPPLEEWMGPQENVQRKSLPGRGQSEENALQAQKRPALAEFHHIPRKSSTAAEDIVLGPPRTAFSSAHARNNPKLDEVESPENEIRTKANLMGKAGPRRGGDTEQRESGLNGATQRRAGREDREDWQSGRSRHPIDEDGEDRPRRISHKERERPRWEPRDPKDGREHDSDGKRMNKDESRLPSRRDGHDRAKFDQPWLRGEKLADGDAGSSRHDSRPQDWRRDRIQSRGDDRERDRYGKAEQDPEWMDSTEPEDSKQSHTQEEFQRWKERMKAGNNTTDEKAGNVETEPAPDAVKPQAAKVDPLSKAIIATAPELDDDKFFANFMEKSAISDAKDVNKAPRKGRFAALFSPPAEEPVKDMQASLPGLVALQEITQTPSHGMASNEADQAGFQRILQMLGQRSNNNTPPEQGGTKPRIRTPMSTQTPQQHILGQPKSPTAEEHHRTGGFDSPPQPRSTVGRDSVLGPIPDRTSRPLTSSTTDAEFLLRLMQQPGQTPNQPTMSQQSQAQSRDHHQHASMLQVQESRDRSQPVQRPRPLPPSIYDNPALLNSPRRDHPPRETLQRRPTDGQPAPFFDEPFFNGLRQTMQQPTPVPVLPGRPPSFPPGMQRPPGFDQVPPGWPTHHQVQQHQMSPPVPNQYQHQHQLVHPPPPGISNPPNRLMNASSYSGGLPPQSIPRPLNMPPLAQHQQPAVPSQQQVQRQRKYTNDGTNQAQQNGPSPMPFIAPGMGPPPGFMNMMNGLTPPPPPGYGGFEGNSNLHGNRNLLDLYPLGAGQPRNGGSGRGGPGSGQGMNGGY